MSKNIPLTLMLLIHQSQYINLNTENKRSTLNIKQAKQQQNPLRQFSRLSKDFFFINYPHRRRHVIQYMYIWEYCWENEKERRNEYKYFYRGPLYTHTHTYTIYV